MRRLPSILLACLIATPAQAKWLEASSKHFVVYSQGSPTMVQNLASTLERFDQALRFVRGMPLDQEVGNANRVTIFIVDEDMVQRLYGSEDVAGFYFARAGGSIAFSSAGEVFDGDRNGLIVLQHEYAHHFMYTAALAAYPGWFSEGFAEFHSTMRFGKDGSFVLGLPADHRGLGMALLPTIPIELLLAPRKHQPLPMEEFYSRGWLLTHYLTFEPSRQGQLRRYLTDLNNGMPALDAAKEAFGDLKKLNGELNDYRHRPISNVTVHPASYTPPTITMRTLTRPEEAMMVVRMKSAHGVNKKNAPDVARDARERAAPYPDSPEAQRALAEAEYDAGNYAESEAAADRALKAKPDYVDALLYKGVAAMQQAEKAKADAKTWQGVRSWFIRANKADPDDPRPMIEFYRSFTDAGQVPTANAAAGLAEAFAIAPYDENLRLTMAAEDLNEKKPQEARAALAPLGYNPHGGKLSDAASDAMGRIDKGELDGLAAALIAARDAPPEEEKKD